MLRLRVWFKTIKGALAPFLLGAKMDNEVKQELNSGLAKLIKAVFTPTNWAGVAVGAFAIYLYLKGKAIEAMPLFTTAGALFGINNKLGNGKL